MSPCEPLPTSAAASKQQASSPGSESESDSSSHFPGIDHIQSLLTKYDITTNGFLPEGPPLEVLPDEYYAPWENLIRRLPALLDVGAFRAEVDDRLAVLEADRLGTWKEEEWRRAYVVLCFFAHGYIWGGARPSEVLPPQIAVPLVAVSSHLDLPPIATYASLNLWNFRCVPESSPSTTSCSLSTDLSLPPSPPLTPAFSSTSQPTTNKFKFDPTNLSNLRTLHTFTNTPSESWFYLVSVAMEAQGAYIIPTMLYALQAIGLGSSDPDWKDTTTKALRELVKCVEAVGELLERMYEGCEPMVFYHQIRPFLAGSKGMGGVGLPRGVFYDLGAAMGEGHVGEEEVQGQRRKGKWMAYRGGSNGQSSLIQFWDLVLGVEHVSAGNSSPHSSSSTSSSSTTAEKGEQQNMKPFHEEVREYMPLKHRQFLALVSKMGLGKGGIRKAVMEMVETATDHEGRDLNQKEVELQKAFQDATRALANFRNKHLQIVARYIVIPSRQAVPEEYKKKWKSGSGSGDEETGGKDGEEVVNLASVSSGLQQGHGREGGKEDEEKKDGGHVHGPGPGPELMGTGGTALLPFLKQTRDETLKAGEVGR
ncbi:Indoleamine 2,3-dioxygenase [Pseudoneurospora amorphoporcata]|uniref:Indoleamine 2,3-dioxygenase n=1 Tax=Pseudoneurospora amorphoporcata TaxID=241081 RepID=A0AAN6NLQ3_9PEZI|nr:Indoleamine 2,3-dioxygenase [Pseudoneurospora amorphoporcata]